MSITQEELSRPQFFLSYDVFYIQQKSHVQQVHLSKFLTKKVEITPRTSSTEATFAAEEAVDWFAAADRPVLAGPGLGGVSAAAAA
jgi:hypothetical protein